MIRPAYAPGALQYSPLRFDKPFVCLVCGLPGTSTSANCQSHPECRGDEKYLAWKRRRQAVYARRKAER